MRQRVLVVDDDGSFAQAYVTALIGLGFEAKFATSGTRALAIAKADGPFDILSLDLALSDEDNPESIFAQVKGFLPAIKLAIVTGQERMIETYKTLVGKAQILVRKKGSSDTANTNAIAREVSSLVQALPRSRVAVDRHIAGTLVCACVLGVLCLVSCNPCVRFVAAFCGTILAAEVAYVMYSDRQNRK